MARRNEVLPSGLWRYPIGPEGDRNGWTTRRDVWERPLHAFGVESYALDPCTNDRATVPADIRCQLDHPDPRFRDGLAFDWIVCPKPLIWLQPPYESPYQWLKRAVDAARRGAVVCGMIRLGPDTAAWQDYGPSRAWVRRGRLECDPAPGIDDSKPNLVMTPCVWATDPADIERWAGAHRTGYQLTRAQEWQA